MDRYTPLSSKYVKIWAAVVIICIGFVLGKQSQTEQVQKAQAKEPLKVSENVRDFEVCDKTSIRGNLYYDPATNIVWMMQTTYGSNIWIPYPAPNGLPYRFNPETETFYMIEDR